MDSIALNSPLFTLNSRNRFWALDNGSKYPYSSSFSFSCLSPCFPQKVRFRGNSSIVAAAKKEDKSTNKRKKDDTHSFVARPDEATGPFPEAVLLKERKVEEDGRLMPEFADAEERELFEALNLELESDLGVDQRRHYEVVYLIHENHKDEVENVNAKVQEFLREKKGKIWRFSDWGMRSLAYKIQKANNAHYILMNFELEAKWINDFKNMLDRDERVIRHLVMKQDKAETEDCPPPPEFHTLQAGMNDDADDEEDLDYDDEEFDDEDWDDEGNNEGIIFVDDDAPDAKVSSSGKTKQIAEKVG
ncbi:Mitochondrial ribosomal protein MRP17 [Handroanthus impetiginosus]|uniref:Mitochondrial ribosomal protein MRP17 n=1 Tax=Handroanthus impetiginosus TaxID=429701 RepID=A0A2G9HKQ6_9LAMI|nr:Mitochondrial ribosomal protein MRP17 [Handroanthus impetiginosus]